MDTFKKTPGLETYFENAYGWAVFPTVGKAGIIVGGAYGTGEVYKKGEIQVGTATLMQVSVGLQWGGQAFSEIIFFENEAAFDHFTSGSFEFSAEAKAVLITASAGAAARTTGSGSEAGMAADSAFVGSAGYQNGMATFTIALGGLMYEATVAGQKFDYKPLAPTTAEAATEAVLTS